MPLEFTAGPDPLASSLHITDATDLVAAVPYLLGFHPHESVVVVGVRDRAVLVSVRVDLADAASDESSALPDAVAAVAHAGAQQLIGVIFSDRRVRIARMPHRRIVDVLGREAAFHHRSLHDVLVVRRDRWWSFRCVDLGCEGCSDEGEPADALSSPFAAAATYHGMVALPSRADLAELFTPAPDRHLLEPLLAEQEHATVQAGLEGHARRHERAVKRAIFAAARAADTGECAPTDEQVARFGAALSSIAVRDSVWLAVDDGRLGGFELWRALGRRLPPPYDAAPLFLAGWSCWRSGNGVLAGMAAERALDSDPDYRAADLLLAALRSALDPHRMPRLRSRSA